MREGDERRWCKGRSIEIEGTWKGCGSKVRVREMTSLERMKIIWVGVISRGSRGSKDLNVLHEFRLVVITILYHLHQFSLLSFFLTSF